MKCKTPALELPSSEHFKSFTAEYEFGFIFKGIEQSQIELPVDATHNETKVFTVEIKVVDLPPVREQHWHDYDSVKKEVLDLKVFIHTIFGNIIIFCSCFTLDCMGCISRSNCDQSRRNRKRYCWSL